MRLLPNSIGALSVATHGEIIHEKCHWDRLRISRSDWMPECATAMFKVNRG